MLLATRDVLLGQLVRRRVLIEWRAVEHVVQGKAVDDMARKIKTVADVVALVTEDGTYLKYGRRSDAGACGRRVRARVLTCGAGKRCTLAYGIGTLVTLG